MTKQYLSLVQKILKNGVSQKTRNGYTIATIGETLRFPLHNRKRITVVYARRNG